MKHFISIRFLSRDEVIQIVIESLRMIPYYCTNQPAPLTLAMSTQTKSPKLSPVFMEKSTRTRLSFEEAGVLGNFRIGSIITPAESSLGKGESITNTIRMIIQQQSDLVILRSEIEGVGLHLAQRLQQTAGPDSWVRKDVPIIVGGAGTRDHPSQVLLDVVTIVARAIGIKRNDDYPIIKQIFSQSEAENELKERISKILDQLTIAFVGDLIHSRVTHDWVHLGKLFSIKFIFIAPKVFQIEDWLRSRIHPGPAISSNLDDALGADITYTIRGQIERLKKIVSEHEARRISRSLQVDDDFIERYDGVIMDAQPIDAESPMIQSHLFNHPQVIMYQQSAMGIPTRMAILRLCYEGRFEDTPLLKVPSVKPKVLLTESIKAHWRRMKKKQRNQQRSVNPIYNGMVLDRINKGIIQLVDLVLARGGVYKKGRGPIIPARECPSPTMGEKEIFFLENRFVPYWLLAAIKILAPLMHVVKLQKGTYWKLNFPVAKAVPQVFVCPNSDCVTNHDPEAETFFYVSSTDKQIFLECAYCEHQFSRQEIIDHLPQKRW